MSANPSDTAMTSAGSVIRRPTAPSPESRVDDIVIGVSVNISGKLRTAGTVFVDGVLEKADVESAALSVSRGGAFRGVARVHRCDIAGSLDGDVHATEEIVLRASAGVSGNLHTPYIVVHRGASFSGHARSVNIDGGDGRAGAGGDARQAPRRRRLSWLLLSGAAVVVAAAVYSLWPA